jgi:antitoxin ParD1/3/4
MDRKARPAASGVNDMPTRNVVLSVHQHELVEGLVQTGRYQNASEVHREGLRLIEECERVEQANLKALKQAARQGWADVSAGRFADVADDQLDNFIGQLQRLAALVPRPRVHLIRLVSA